MNGGEGGRESGDGFCFLPGEFRVEGLLFGDIVKSWTRGDECVDDMVRSCCLTWFDNDLAVFIVVLAVEWILGGEDAPVPNESAPTAFSSVDALLRVKELA
jgi:hypothetical protein